MDDRAQPSHAFPPSTSGDESSSKAGTSLVTLSGQVPSDSIRTKTPAGKTKTLSLCEKLQLIEEHEQQKVSPRQLALKYGVGKTQVYETLKNKEKIKSELQRGTSGQRKRLAYASSFEDINNIMWDWFTKRMAEGLAVSGPMIQAEALRVAQTLGRTEFKASNGWLESFRLRHNIVSNQTRVEAKDVIVVIKEDWKDYIPKITEGVSEEDIFIAVETTLRHKMLPPEYGDCSERLGVMLCMNMRGMMLKPLVVGKKARPKSFGKLDAASFPVQWMPSSQGCITNFVLEEWLHCFNQVAVLGNRKTILFLDVRSCQPVVSLSNVRLVTCPEPMDKGIVFYFKCLFRKNLLQTILLKVGDLGIGEVCKMTSVLEAVNWISRAVGSIPCDLVRKCFFKSGFSKIEGACINDMAEGIVCADISELCERLNLDAEEVIRFDDEFDDDVMIKEEPEEQDEKVKEEEKMNVNSFSDAILVLNDLEKFAAAKSCQSLLNVLQDAKEALAQSCLYSCKEP